MTENAWVDQIFEAAATEKGGIVRRAISHVMQQDPDGELYREVRRRGWHLIETGDQYIVICNDGAIKIHC